MCDLVPLVIDHPLSTLTEAEIEVRAEQARRQCVAVWRGVGYPSLKFSLPMVGRDILG
jgi:hypothetical protein